jgi:hypothetical protein
MLVTAHPLADRSNICAFADICLVGAGEEDLHVNGDSWIFSTLNHAILHPV